MRSLFYLIGYTILHSIAAFNVIHANEYPKTGIRDSISIPVEIFTSEYIAESASFTVPFSRAGNLMLIKARADSIEGNFILDTGCPGLVLNLTYFRHYANSNEQELERSSMTGTIQAVNQATVLNFVLGPVRYFRLEADLVNLGHIENTKGAKILGLLGMSLLRNFEMIIDHEKSLIHFHRIGRKEANTWQHEMLRDTSAYYTVPFEIIDQRIIIRTDMGGKKIRLIIDTGAETNILDSRLPDKVFENVSITGRIMITGAGNNRVEALQGDLSGIRIGGQLISTLPVIVTNLEKTCFSYSGCVDGILGFDFLSLQKFGFNFVTRKMYIWK